LRATIVASIERLMGERSPDPEIRRRQFVLAFILSTISAVGVFIVVAVAVLAGPDHPTVWMTLILLALNFTNLAFLRQARNPTGPAKMFLICLANGLLAISLMGGGVHSGAVLWLVLVPVIAVLLLPRDSARWYTAYASVGLAGLTVVDVWIGNPWTENPSPAPTVWISFICGITAIVAAHLVAGYNESVQTRMRRLIRRRDAQLQELRRAEALGRMAGGVAHDFNNLMTVVSSHSALMRMDHPEPEFAEPLDALDEVVQQSNELTSKLLAYLEKEITVTAIVDVDHTVSSLLHELDEIADARIDVVFRGLGERLPVRIDQARLEGAVMALAQNACDAMPDGGELTISVERETGGSIQGAVIRIQDTGTGMTPEVLERAFEPFFTTKDMTRGTGLGLASVKGIVQGAGGAIDVATTPGEGSTFRIWLPIEEERVDAEQEADADEPTSTSQPPVLTVVPRVP
jgi:signal transduction histidine kinase